MPLLFPFLALYVRTYCAGSPGTPFSLCKSCLLFDIFHSVLSTPSCLPFLQHPLRQHLLPRAQVIQREALPTFFHRRAPSPPPTDIYSWGGGGGGGRGRGMSALSHKKRGHERGERRRKWILLQSPLVVGAETATYVVCTQLNSDITTGCCWMAHFSSNYLSFHM